MASGDHGPKRRSLSFGFLNRYGSHFDRLGADAERLVHEHPDLALMRARQMVELAALVLEQASGVTHPGRPSLDDRLLALAIPRQAFDALNAVRKLSNDAAHIDRAGPKPPQVHHKAARRALPLMHRALVWLHTHVEGRPPEVVFRAPPSRPGRDAELYDELMRQLDDAEGLIDIYYSLAQGAARLDDLDAAIAREVGQRRVTPAELQLLRLRHASLTRALRNHRGEPVRVADLSALSELGPPLVATNDPAAIEEVAELRNRVAVGYLNAIDFERAHDVLAPLLEWQRERSARLDEALGALPLRNELLGRLLGTFGQVAAFRAHAYLDAASLDEAIACFDEARERFSEPEDIARQETYAAHALVEKREHFGPGALSPADARRLDALVARWEPDARVMTADPLLREHPRGHAFRLSLLLKHALVTETRPPWLKALTDAFVGAVAADHPALGHPYEQIVGYLVLLHLAGPPAPLIRLAEAQAAQTTLSGHIARTFALERARRTAGLRRGMVCDYRRGRPDAIAAWWADFDLDARLDALAGPPTDATALQLLPFNYA